MRSLTFPLKSLFFYLVSVFPSCIVITTTKQQNKITQVGVNCAITIFINLRRNILAFFQQLQPPLDVLGGEVPLLHHVLGGPGHCIDPGLVVVDLGHGGLVLLDHLLLLIWSRHIYISIYVVSLDFATLFNLI